MSVWGFVGGGSLFNMTLKQMLLHLLSMQFTRMGDNSQLLQYLTDKIPFYGPGSEVFTVTYGSNL